MDGWQVNSSEYVSGKEKEGRGKKKAKTVEEGGCWRVR